MNYSVSLTQNSFRSIFKKNVSWHLHVHRQIEVVVVTKGTLTMQINRTKYEIPSKHAVFVEPYEPHSFLSSEPNVCAIIEFSVEVCPQFYEWIYTHRADRRLIELSDETYGYLIPLLPQVYEGADFQSLDFLHTNAILSTVCYMVQSGCEWSSEKKQYDDVLLQAMDIISQHYADSLSRDSVARELGIRPETLSRIFSQKSNISFTEQVQYIRIYQVLCRLERGASVTDAAFEAGFESVRTFNRVFKKIIGKTPTEYLKQL